MHFILQRKRYLPAPAENLARDHQGPISPENKRSRYTNRVKQGHLRSHSNGDKVALLLSN